MAINTSLTVARSSARTFPEGFVFGAATAAYQIEGAATEGGRQPSIWDTFSSLPGAVFNGDTGAIACDHYHRFRDDVALMAELGIDSYRFSVSWARVVPDGKNLNRAGLDFYSALVDELLAHGITPWLTLYHWDLPQALGDKGGWTNRDTSYRFRDYAATVFDALKDRVPTWTTLNEPWCASFVSYTAGTHAPGHYSMAEGLLASHHLLLGHGLAVEAMRESAHGHSFGLTLNLSDLHPVDPVSEADRNAARKIDGQLNRWFFDPVFKASYPADILADFRACDPCATDKFEAAVHHGDLTTIGAPIETLGVNYYQGDAVAGNPVPPPVSSAAPISRPTASPFPDLSGVYFADQHLPHTAMNWDVDPEGFTSALLRVHNDYTAPSRTALFVTENGVAYNDVVTGTPPTVHDPERSDYIELHLGALLDAIDAGADIRGYFYWSLMDNYEWNWGYSQRFGIIYVDFLTQQRIIKDSGRTYQRVISERTINVAPHAGRQLRETAI
ncbi:MAG: GH1 family beta-glucosidase [Ancrocorticia sp.]|nr:GH1 family beta-glucosidase [Ancrocorticia sp.]MCI1896281.1 GH1 family beta-glucosidase [Ancrocorticia sp.]MCI1962676.1 GH1 family beta-glucosidase [Ancrocorticia sp.]MCI2002043.1 GH1 family beta-glucosidase [Ancrocorticia sp.]MCI2012471.1 GH1 family beta-glucosidase [Ancrocorticia sp.]